MADNVAINGLIDKILSPFFTLMEWLISVIFSSKIAVFIIFILLVNGIAIILMKRDKEYAQKGERRISEATFMIVALVGGSLGIYYAMFKYKHKTLHNKFSIGVPAIIVLQFAYISYLFMSKIL